MYTLLSNDPTEKLFRSTPDAIVQAPVRTEILVVRHAEVHNPKDILYGRLPRFGLSERGRRQAEATARFLAGRPISAIYTSPLLRARQTAVILAQHLPEAEYHTASALMEVRTGYQGEPNTILKPGFSFYHPKRNEGDESMEDVAARMLGIMRLIARRHAGSAAVAVSHADPIAILRLAIEGKEMTARNLHSTVYPERSSVTQVIFMPGEQVRLNYFDPASGVTLKSA